MRPINLILRGYTKYSGGQWSAVCIDLCLAAQADSRHEAYDKLNVIRESYLNDALGGEDSSHAAYLMSRKAPLSQRLFYHWLRLKSKVGVHAENLKSWSVPVHMNNHCPQ